MIEWEEGFWVLIKLSPKSLASCCGFSDHKYNLFPGAPAQNSTTLEHFKINSLVTEGPRPLVLGRECPTSQSLVLGAVASKQLFLNVFFSSPVHGARKN